MAFVVFAALIALVSPGTTEVSNLAAKRYDRLWEKVARYYGADKKAAPRHVFTSEPHPEPGMWVSPEAGVPTVHIDPQTQRRLATTGKRSRAKRIDARARLLHEWAHVYQDRSRLTESYDREGGASLFAIKVGRKVLKNPGLVGNPQTLAFKQKYGKGFWRKGQFGSNYGADPNSIIYPQP